MDNNTVLSHKIHDIVELARFAPSVHNIQPWLVDIGDGAIIVSADERYKLGPGDPTGRETVLSLGIFCEAIKLAAAEYGLEEVSCRYSDNAVRLEFKESGSPAKLNEFPRLIKNRATDRSIYKTVEIDETYLDRIRSVPCSKDVTVHVSKKPEVINAVTDLTGKGIGLALSNPSFRRELSGYLIPLWSGKKRGISAKSLYLPWLLELAEPFLLRFGIGLKTEVKVEKKRWQSSSAIVFITAEGDLAKHWFEAGRSYLRASLAIESLGLSQATSAATVEASNYHEDIEEMLGTNQRLLCVIRIGKGSGKRRYSPRVKAADLITSNPRRG